jgi:hypothetical protein
MGEVTGQRLRVEQNGIVVVQSRAAKVQWMLKSCSLGNLCCIHPFLSPFAFDVAHR